MNYNDILLFCSKNKRTYQVCSWATVLELRAMEVEKTGQHIWTFWVSTKNGVEPHEETLFARKPTTQIHEAEQPGKPFQEGKVMC